MSSNKQIVVIIILVIAVAVAVAAYKSKSDAEKFINVPQTAYIDAIDDKPGYAPDDFLSRPNYKPQQAPRFYAGDLTGELRGAMPPANLSAIGKNPMEFVNMAGEKYEKAKDNKGYSEQQLNSMAAAGIEDPLQWQDVSLPGSNMEMNNYGRDPEDPETYTYDRLIYANQRRRGLNSADFIRGDLKIEPDNRGWFQVSARKHLDLRTGAFEAGIIGGKYDQQELQEFRQKINYGDAGHIGPEYTTSIGQGDTGSDVQVDRNISRDRIAVTRYN